MSIFMGTNIMPKGSNMPTPVDTNVDDLAVFIIPSSGISYQVGTVRLSASMPRPTERIPIADGTQYWIGMQGVGFPPTLRMDFYKDTTQAVFAQYGFFTGGAPFRHGGAPQYCTTTNANRGKCKANYLFCDGHVETLDYLTARAQNAE